MECIEKSITEPNPEEVDNVRMNHMTPEKTISNKKQTEDFIKNPAPSKIIFVSQKVQKPATLSESGLSELK